MNGRRAYFTRIDATAYQPERWCMGAWNVEELHVAPVNGLLMHGYEAWNAERGANELVTARVSFEYLGVIDFTPCELTYEVIRPGRAVELVEGVVHQHGRPVLRGRIWRLAASDTTAVAGGMPQPMPHPVDCPAFDMTSTWPGDYIDTLDVRAVTTGEPGTGRRWLRSTIDDVVAGEPSSDLVRWLLLVDTCNGIAVRESPDAWQFPNLDLAIHLARQPAGDWLGADVHVTFGPDGQGITRAGLFDAQGFVGEAAMGLLVRRRG